MTRSSSVWAVTATNRNLISQFHDSLESNFEAIATKLDEDDFPVEFYHENGCGMVFRDRADLTAFIKTLAEELARAA